MGTVSEIKEIAKLVLAAGNTELYQKISNLSMEIADLIENNFELKAKVRDLSDKLALKETMIFRAPFYFTDGDNVPYCPNCWENDSKCIHLTGPRDTNIGPRYDCPQCKRNFFSPEIRREGPSSIGVNL